MLSLIGCSPRSWVHVALLSLLGHTFVSSCITRNSNKRLYAEIELQQTFGKHHENKFCKLTNSSEQEFSVPKPPEKSDSYAVGPYSGNGYSLDLHTTAPTLLRDLRTYVYPALCKHLIALSEKPPSLEVGVEIAGSLHLLKLIKSAIDEREIANVEKTAREAAVHLQKGAELLKQAQTALVSVMLTESAQSNIE